MKVVSSDDSVDSDTFLREQVQIVANESGLQFFRNRIEGILNWTRAMTGRDLFLAPPLWNPLGLGPSSIETRECASVLRRGRDNLLTAL